MRVLMNRTLQNKKDTLTIMVMIFNLIKFGFVRNFIRNKIKKPKIEVNRVKSCFSRFKHPKNPLFLGWALGWDLGFLGFKGLGLGWVKKPKTQPKNPNFLGFR